MFARSKVTNSPLTLTAVFTFAATLALSAHAGDAGSANWKKLAPPNSPPARAFPTMAYDPVSKKIVLFGGVGQTYLNDTWTFDGSTWTREKTPVAPPARSASSMAFDKRTKKMVMFGGFDGKSTELGFLHDTWLWDGATSTWTQARMRKLPPRASGPSLFSDPRTGGAMMFGGYDRFKSVPAYNATWRWTGTSWQKLHPKTSPYPRGWGIAVLDPVRKNVVVTGGDGDTIRTDNTWTWDGANWTQKSPATQVQALTSAGAAFDLDSQLVIVFGGFAGNTTNQTWSWDGSNWVQLSPANSPSVRDGLGMDYYPGHHEVVLFGGEASGGGQVLRDTWKWSGR
jgi:hypothetical protein